jgi:hypothetical protein
MFITARLLEEHLGVLGIPVTWCAIAPFAWRDWNAIHDSCHGNSVRQGRDALSQESSP